MCNTISARLSQTAVQIAFLIILISTFWLCTAFGGVPQQGKGMSCIMRSGSQCTGNVQAFKVTIDDCCTCKRNAVLVLINLHDKVMWIVYSEVD